MKAARILLAAMAVLATALVLCVLLGFAPSVLRTFRDVEITNFPAVTGVLMGVSSSLLALWPLTVLIVVAVVGVIVYVAVSRRVADQKALPMLSCVLLVLAVCAVLAMLALIAPLTSAVWGPNDP
jgi:hypothetical protein